MFSTYLLCFPELSQILLYKSYLLSWVNQDLVLGRYQTHWFSHLYFSHWFRGLGNSGNRAILNWEFGEPLTQKAYPSILRLKMEARLIFMVSSTLLLLCSSSALAQTAKSPSLSPTPAPAPAPAPDYVNLTDLFSVAGPFHTFLTYLESTKVLETLQNQANNTDEGVTIFVPKDSAFSSLKKPSLSNLTNDQLKSLLLFHALPHYYTLSDFKNLSQMSPINTMAGGGMYSLNFTDVSGTVHLTSGWTNTKVTSSVHSTDPVSVFQVDKLLLPEAIFGTDIPPTPAPAPAPESIAPAADSPSDNDKTESNSPLSSSGKSSSNRLLSFGIFGQLSLVLAGVVALFL